jgi:hypothetical protein
MTTQVQTVSVETLCLISHKNVPVVTTELLAQLYGTVTNNIKNNFSNNINRFVEGKHYFKLEGQDLREFKNWVNNIDSVKISKNTRNLILWTERGAARHAKMLDTDQAWEVFERLEDCYFGKQPEPVKNPRLLLRNAIHAVAKGDRQTYSNLYNRLYRKFQVTSYKDLDNAQCVAAVEFIKSVEGDYIARDKITPPKPSLVLCDGQHYVVAKDGAVLMHKVLSHDINDSCLKTMGIGQDKFEALVKDLEYFFAPMNNQLEMNYQDVQNALSCLSGIIIALERQGLPLSGMYQQTGFIKNFLTNYYSRLEAIHFQICSISKNMSLEAIAYASDICRHPTLSGYYGAKIA